VQTCSFRIMENQAYGWTGLLQAGSTQESGGKGTFYLNRQNKLNRAITLLFSINRSLRPEWNTHSTLRASFSKHWVRMWTGEYWRLNKHTHPHTATSRQVQYCVTLQFRHCISTLNLSAIRPALTQWSILPLLRRINTQEVRCRWLHSMENRIFNTLSHSEEDIRISMMTQFTLLSDNYICGQYTSQFLIQFSARHASTQIRCFITYLLL